MADSVQMCEYRDCNRVAGIRCPVCAGFYCALHMIHGIDHAPEDRNLYKTAREVINKDVTKVH